MKKSPSILELNNYVTLARMLSILGQYEKALSNYNISLQIIKERKTQVNNTPLKDIWNDLENVINTEISLTDETLKISQKFQITYNPRAVPIEEWNNKKTKIPIPFYMYCHLKGYDYDKKVTEILQQEIMEKNTNVKYTNIFGLDDNINILKETVLLPLLIPEFFIGVRHPPKGVLLFGPPGMGKTLLSKALASEGKINFFNISPVVLIKKWKGESVKIVRIIFEMAKFYAPSIVHIDEVDLIGKRKYEYDYENVSVSWKLMGEIIEQMDKINSQFC